MNHLLGIEHLCVEDIQLIFKYAAYYKRHIKHLKPKDQILANKVVILFFCEPSTRTRISFEIAAKKLNADVINVATDTSSIRKGETLLDTLKTFEALEADFIVMRHAHSGVPHQLAPSLKSMLINAGDGAHEHPSQALLDAFTLQEALGSLKGKSISIIGDILHSRVARSGLLIFKKLGANVTLCGPETLLPSVFKQMGAKVTYNLKEALTDADIVNVLRIQRERESENFIKSIADYVKHYRVNETDLQHHAKHDLLICHPGPVNREIALTSKLMDSKCSCILDQVTNGLFIRMAIFRFLYEKGARL